MPRNGSGIFTFPPSSWNPPVNGANATAADWANLLQDLANAITLSLASDGQTPMTGPLNMGGNRINNLGAPVGQNQALRWQQLAEGPNIASASTITIPNEGGLFLVTGTTTIKELSGSYIGRRATLLFQDEVTIESSPQLIIPGGGNYTTEAGDILEFIRISATAWSLISSVGGSGAPGGNVMVITSTQNIVMPSNRIWVTGCGPGGNGRSGPAGYGGRSGGGGAVFIRREFAVTKGQTLTATIGTPTNTPGGYGTPTSIAGLFALNSGQTPTDSTSVNTGGLGGAASSAGLNGISAKGGDGGGRSIGGTGVGGGGGGSLGGGGGGGGASGGGNGGIVLFGTSPTNGSGRNGGNGIGVGYGSNGGTTASTSGGAGSYGAGGGGSAAGSGSGGAGGPGLLVIEW